MTRAIPNHLILFWHNRAAMPADILLAVERTMQINRGARLTIADDASMYDFIRRRNGAGVLHLFESLAIPAARSDVARLMLLLEHGGLYMDASMEALQPITSILDPGAETILVRRDDLYVAQGLAAADAHVCNGIVGAAPGSRLIEQTLQIVLDNVRERKDDGVWATTGIPALRHHRRRVSSI